MKDKKIKRFSGFGKHLSVMLMAILYLLAPVLLFINQTQPAYAISGAFLDAATVKIGDLYYRDANPFDGNHNYRAPVANASLTKDGCESEFTISGGSWESGIDKKSLGVTLQVRKVSNNKCVDSPKETVALVSTDRMYITGYVVDSRTLFLPVYIVKGDYSTSRKTQGVFKSNQAADTIYLIAGDNDYSDGGTRVTYKGQTLGKIESQKCDKLIGCGATSRADVIFNVATDAPKPDKGAYPDSPGAGGGTDAVDDVGDKCYDGGAFGIFKNPLKWIVCGLSSLLASAVDGANSAIAGLLKFDPTAEGKSSDLKKVWGNMLNIANILFVIAFLVMIISTALDLGVFSSYTVKKLLPRIIIAAIIANLSWSICSTLISVTNVVGAATREVILSPLNMGKEGTAATLQGAVNTQGGAVYTAAVVTGLGALIYFSIASAGAILLPVLATAFIAAVVALAALLLRRIALILLIIFAPLAFAMWALPGGEKWFQRWWKLFMEMLMMYPMIMALFAAGIFISQLMPQLDSGDGSSGLGIMTAAVSAVALILPYFLIPVLFKVASGTLSNITGMINDRSKGLIDRSKNWRDKNSQYGRRKDMKAKRKNFTGHEKMLHGMHGEGFMASRRRGQALGRAWMNDGAKSGQRMFLAQTKAAASKERLQAADYDLQAGGIDTRGEIFTATHNGNSYQVKKDDALVLASMGAVVTNKRTGDVIADGSSDAQRAAAMYATSQGLEPVVNKLRGTSKEQFIQQVDDTGNKSTTTAFNGLEQLKVSAAAGDTASRDQYYQANGVLSEAMQTNVGAMMPKMTSYFKGPAQAFGRIEAGALSQFAPSEAEALVDWAADSSNFTEGTPAEQAAAQRQAIDRIGDSVKRIISDPSKFNASPEMLKDLKARINDRGLVLDPTHSAELDKVKADGTLDI